MIVKHDRAAACTVHEVEQSIHLDKKQISCLQHEHRFLYAVGSFVGELWKKKKSVRYGHNILPSRPDVDPSYGRSFQRERKPVQRHRGYFGNFHHGEVFDEDAYY